MDIARSAPQRFMVLRVRLLPSRFPTTILYTPLDILLFCKVTRPQLLHAHQRDVVLPQRQKRWAHLMFDKWDFSSMGVARSAPRGAHYYHAVVKYTGN